MIVVTEDLKAQNIAVTENEIVKRCRRFIPEPKVLEERLKKLYSVYKDTHYIDEDNQRIYLFKPTMDSIHQNALLHVRKSCLSDPPTIPLYFQRVKKKSDVTFGCKRGTSALEGYHSGLKGIFVGGVVSAQLADILLANYNFRWNIRNGVRNRGEKDYFFYDHHLIERIKMMGSNLEINLYSEYQIANPRVKEKFGCIDVAHGAEMKLFIQSNDDLDDAWDTFTSISTKRVRSDKYIAFNSNLPSHPKQVRTKDERNLYEAI
jgi:hypothetical protein